MVHVPIALGVALPFGDIQGNAPGSLPASAGAFTNFELGVGIRVKQVVVDFLMFSIGGAGLTPNSPLGVALAQQGYEPHGPFRFFFGADGAYQFSRSSAFLPWVGGRLGYEAMGFSGSAGDRERRSYSFDGLYGSARGGIDFRLSPAFGLGVALEVGWGMFLGGKTSLDIEDDPITLEYEGLTDEAPLDLQGGSSHGYVGLSGRAVFFP